MISTTLKISRETERLPFAAEKEKSIPPSILFDSGWLSERNLLLGSEKLKHLHAQTDNVNFRIRTDRQRVKVGLSNWEKDTKFWFHAMMVTMMTSAYAMLGAIELHCVVPSYRNENSVGLPPRPEGQKTYIIGMPIPAFMCPAKGMDRPCCVGLSDEHLFWRTSTCLFLSSCNCPVVGPSFSLDVKKVPLLESPRF